MWESWKIALVDCFYVTLGPDILRNCGLCIRKRVKLKDTICFGNPIRFYLVRNDVVELNDQFYHFQYATLEMFKGTFIKYSKLKYGIFTNTHTIAMYLKNVSHQYCVTNQDPKPRILSQNWLKEGGDQCLSFIASFITQSLFLWKVNWKMLSSTFRTR